MTDKKTEALKLALEALNRNDYLGWQTNIHVREAIREALAEQPAQQQEPVAWYHAEKYKTHFTSIPSEDLIESGYWKPLYTSPPANKPWVGLTDEEIAYATAPVFIGGKPSLTGIAEAIEAKLREKNA